MRVAARAAWRPTPTPSPRSSWRAAAAVPYSSPPTFVPPPQRARFLSSDALSPPLPPAATDLESDASPESVPPSGPSVEDVLQRLAQSKFHIRQASEILGFLALPQQRDAVAAIKDDPRLAKLVKMLESNAVNVLQTRGVVSCLKALEALQGALAAAAAADSLAVLNLENSLVWRARTASMRDLTLLLSFVCSRRKGNDPGQSSKLFKEVVLALERRWVEVVDGKTFAGIMHYPECFTPQFMNKIDDRVIDTAENLLPQDLTTVGDEILDALATLGLKSVISFADPDQNGRKTEALRSGP